MTFIKILISLLFFIPPTDSQLKDEFYNTLASNNITQIEELLFKINSLKSSDINNAYIATLQMKQSNFEKVLKRKISLFKEGANTLDFLITKSPNTLELKFLRLIIQEKAPQILKYNSNIKKDKESILLDYRKQSKNLQNHIIQYAKISSLINENELDINK